MASIPLFRYLRDANQNWNANGDYAGQPLAFGIAPPANQTYRLRRMIGHILWTGTPQAQFYGPRPALQAGIQVQIVDKDGLKMDLTDGVPIRTQESWSRLMYDTSLRAYGLQAVRFFSFRWTFWRGPPEGLLLNGKDGERFELLFNDDLSSLQEHSFMVQGEILQKGKRDGME